MPLGLIRYVREGVRRKFQGFDSGRGRIVVIENSQLGFDLGPLLAKVLRVPHADVRIPGAPKIPRGRRVVSSGKIIPHQYMIDLNGNFGEYLLEGLTRGVDIRIEALKISLQQLTIRKG